MDNPDNLGLFTLNDIASYDRATIPYLDRPPGSALVRDGNRFVGDPEGTPIDPDQSPTADLQPGFPVVEGRFDMTPEWAITLTEPMNRRFDDDAMVFRRAGLTAWLTIWGNPDRDTPEIRLSQVKQMSTRPVQRDGVEQ